MRSLVLTLCCTILYTGVATAQTEKKKQPAVSDSTTTKKSYSIKKAIVIEADRALTTVPPPRHTSTIEAALQSEPSVALIRRANFALEPTLRGMSGGQIAITIDGMKMHAACVDKMDPITAYVEPENLRQLELSSGSSDLSTGQTQGGSLNLVTIKPSFYEGLTGNAELSASSNAPFGRVRGSVNYSLNNTAARGSFSVKRSGDYSAGGGRTIGNSGFEKENYKLDILQRLPAEQEISIGYIRDNARAIGYPALIMDATKTESNILSADYRMRSVSSLFRL
ncbi:MAG: TonB-dependent receptor plug domain-containing protein [Ignavibacteria bacterium]|nr:TonB-dependent receptor plug domain-containing protein [Ignavibacteria bacterium]